MYTMDELRQYCMNCKKCRLHETRTNVVFGDGNENANLMFVGEGPGFNEDKQGIPFVGKAGQLFDRMIRAIDLTREDIYIANIVKCRPPGNRNPLDDESEICIQYLRWQVKLIKPKIIVCLGAVSAKNLIRKDFKISKERGIWIEKGNIKFMPTYHPAYLLRNPSAKKDAWDDFKKIRDELKELEI